jgi:AcrR family transcriptional regulator
LADSYIDRTFVRYYEAAMVRRTYQQSARLQGAETTRRRIVEATFALHAEQGIAATTMKQIAARAGVSVGSVYHHFPTYDDAIGACGQLVLEKAPPLGDQIFDGLPAWPERVARLLLAQYAQYERLPVLEAARADRHVSPKLEAFLTEEERHRRALAAEALKPLTQAGPAVAALAAMADIGVWRALTSAGFDTATAAAQAAEMFHAWQNARP